MGAGLSTLNATLSASHGGVMDGFMGGETMVGIMLATPFFISYFFAIRDHYLYDKPFPSYFVESVGSSSGRKQLEAASATMRTSASTTRPKTTSGKEASNSGGNRVGGFHDLTAPLSPTPTSASDSSFSSGSFLSPSRDGTASTSASSSPSCSPGSSSTFSPTSSDASVSELGGFEVQMDGMPSPTQLYEIGVIPTIKEEDCEDEDDDDDGDSPEATYLPPPFLPKIDEVEEEEVDYLESIAAMLYDKAKTKGSSHHDKVGITQALYELGQLLFKDQKFTPSKRVLHKTEKVQKQVIQETFKAVANAMEEQAEYYENHNMSEFGALYRETASSLRSREATTSPKTLAKAWDLHKNIGKKTTKILPRSKKEPSSSREQFKELVKKVERRLKRASTEAMSLAQTLKLEAECVQREHRFPSRHRNSLRRSAFRV